MNVTASIARYAHEALASVDDTDITSPDMARADLVAAIVRLAENLRTVTTHAERQEETNTRLSAEIDQLRAENDRLRDKIRALRAKADKA
jgi:uncharacterized coiled-coil DUF342 family protein